MVRRLVRMLTGIALGVGLTAGAAAAPRHPYVDPTQAALPMPYYSFARQPWRSYLQTVPATQLLDGLGAVWGPSVPEGREAIVAENLSAAGFRRVRIELPWSSMRWDEDGMAPEQAARTLRVLHALKQQHLRPLILLNANDAAPCPMTMSTLHLTRDVPAGSTEIQVTPAGPAPPAGAVVQLILHDGTQPDPLVVGSSGTAGVLRLSRPTHRALNADQPLQVAVLKYAPLDAIGSAAFERTSAGWLRYARYMTQLVAAEYGPEFDVEIWNELTFGSAFLDAGRYQEPQVEGTPDALHAGGRAWEIARRTVQQLRQLHPDVRVIWGFSNTTFFHTAVTELPPGIQGQSYHPYGTGPRCYAAIVAGREGFNAGGFQPPGCATMPEGWAHSFQQTETLVRLLEPAVRARRPPESPRFEHFLTEHGVDPRELGIADVASAWRAKAKFLLRAPVFWLNKGISALYVHLAVDANELAFGMLSPDGAKTVATRALQRFTARFEGARAVTPVRQLSVAVTRAGPVRPAYANDPDGKVVAPEDVVAVLPFQSDARKFVIVTYVMTEDFPRDLAPQAYRIRLEGVAGRGARIQYYDPLDDRTVPVRVLTRGANDVVVQLDLTDTPRLLEITES